MDGVEASGRTVEEAVQGALAQIGLDRSQVEVEVLSEGRAGIFGLGAEEARVVLHAVASAAASPDLVEQSRQVLEELLRLLHVEATVTTRPPETPGDGLGHVSVVLDVNGDDLGILIGRRGETLASLQYLVNLILSRRFQAKAAVGIDVAGYKRRREVALRGLAQRMAERVKSTGRSVTLEPMPAADRRIVHLALAQDPEVTTASIGDGEQRKVAISRRS